MKITVKIEADSFDKDCRHVLVNGRHVMNVWKKKDGRWSWWESDRFSNTYDTIAEVKRHMAACAAANAL